MGRLVSLLVLADGRFPAGTYAHALGLEEAVRQELVVDLATTAAYVDGVLATSGVLAAHAAAAAWQLERAAAPADRWLRLDAEIDARTASPWARHTARLLGRHLLRAAAALGPSAEAAARRAAADGPAGPQQVLALGAVVAAVGGGADEAALLAVLGVASGVVQGAVRLLGLDPVAATGLLAGRADHMEALASKAAARSATVLEDWPASLAELPATAGAMLDHLLECQAARPDRLFAS
jgi:urease accessory protein